jgi:hypothetical protein
MYNIISQLSNNYIRLLYFCGNIFKIDFLEQLLLNNTDNDIILF